MKFGIKETIFLSKNVLEIRMQYQLFLFIYSLNQQKFQARGLDEGEYHDYMHMQQIQTNNNIQGLRNA